MTTHYAPNARETFNARTAEHNAAIAALTLTPPQRRAVHAVATGTDQFTPGDHVQLIGPSWLEAGMLGHVITITDTAKGGGYFASEPSEEWYVEAETGSQYEGTLVTIHPKTTDAESRARAERIAAEHFPYDGTEPDTVTECRRRAVAAVLQALTEKENAR